MKNTKISRRSFLLGLLCRRGPDGLLRQQRACFVCFHRPGTPCFLGCQ